MIFVPAIILLFEGDEQTQKRGHEGSRGQSLGECFHPLRCAGTKSKLSP